MRDLTKDIIEALSEGSPTAREYFQEIISKLEASGFKDPDIEAIMDVVTARQDPNRARLTIGPRIVEFADPPSNQATDMKATVLLGTIKGAVEARCSKADFRESDAHYEKFFKEFPTGRINGVIPMALRQVFTTNYDRCIESFLRKYGYEDGFQEKAGYGRVFTANWPETEAATFTLCKLHGSVDWWEVGGRIIQSSFVLGQSLTDEQVTGRMMVYPASEKYALTSPYAECLFYFRRSLMGDRRGEPVVVVGYSFRDASVNNAFADAIKTNPNIRIFSLGRHATAHQYELEEPLRSKVVPVDGDFGSSKSLDALRSAIGGGGYVTRIPRGG